jgi:ankyrin repeat protein
MLACFAGQLKVVKMLRQAGARYDDFDRGGSTPLHWAVDGGNTYLLEWMIEDGAQVNIPDHNCGWTTPSWIFIVLVH